MADESEQEFLVNSTKELFSDDLFRSFFCHGFLDGDYNAETRRCDCPPLTARKQHKLDHFRSAMCKDLGEEFYAEKVAPIIDETLQQLNGYRN